MSPKKQDDRSQEPKTNSQLKSSIVHKPFATGTINIFNPHRAKNSGSNGQLTAPKLFLNAEIEKAESEKSEQLTSLTDLDSEPVEIEYHDSSWLERLLNPWSVGAIAIIFLANLISGAVIWRNYRLASDIITEKNLPTLGSANIATEEFMPLNLSTLSRLKTAESAEEEATIIEPISPALAPINLSQSTINPEYHYILTEYRGDSSLAQVRQQVKHVSLVNLPQGVFIYLGAYKDRDEAERYIAYLAQANLAAQIYPLN
ncbi:MAG: hypothetical protein AAFR63_14745 [Cyanobacteria bacterium J06631_6]